MTKLSLDPVHQSWQTSVVRGLELINPDYKAFLESNTSWLPGAKQIFNAFSLDLNRIRYLLLGESPYPRADSANGYAFWDGRVGSLWSDKGLSSTVNRATSLRNFMKMLLVAGGHLTANDTSQAAIAALDKSHLVQTCRDLFENMQTQGILLLNASLVLSDQPIRKDAKAWHPFMEVVLNTLYNTRLDLQLLLFGKVAEMIQRFPVAAKMPSLIAEHPYNISFISNPQVLTVFGNMKLLHA